MTNGEQVQIDWANVAVRDGSLSVRLTGDVPKGWDKDFKVVLALLGKGSDGWGEINVNKKAIEVANVRQGSEGDLRHLLESVLLQVNADLQGDHAQADEQGGQDPVQQADDAMAETFRGFAVQDE
jgi:hypothetical protein